MQPHAINSLAADNEAKHESPQTTLSEKVQGCTISISLATKSGADTTLQTFNAALLTMLFPKS